MIDINNLMSTMAGETSSITSSVSDKKSEMFIEKVEERLRKEIQREFESKLQSEADRRVTQALKRREREFENKIKRYKIAEEERIKAKDLEISNDKTKREYELTMMELRLDVVNAIAELGLDPEFRNLIAIEDLALISNEHERKKKLRKRMLDIKILFNKELDKSMLNVKRDILKGITPTSVK